MIGYGSLIDEASRRRTVPHAIDATPIALAGYRRTWGHRVDAVGYVGATTFLTVVPDAAASLNGVVFEMPEDRLEELDARERGYDRVAIPPTALTVLSPEDATPSGAIWMYVSDPADLREPDAEFPIIQSYVDVCMSGCFDIERAEPPACAGYARDFVSTTQGWSAAWVNDRIHPRRPQRDVPYARDIDTMLRDMLPQQFAAIRIDS
jgi:hypothetical protein